MISDDGPTGYEPSDTSLVYPSSKTTADLTLQDGSIREHIGAIHPQGFLPRYMGNRSRNERVADSGTLFRLL